MQKEKQQPRESKIFLGFFLLIFAYSIKSLSTIKAQNLKEDFLCQTKILSVIAVLHKDYLLKHKKVLFTTHLTQGKLYQHRAEIEKQAREKYDAFIRQIKEAEGVTEQLEEENQL